MTRHLLDSDSVFDVLHGVTATVALLQRLARQGDTLCTSDVVLGEVYAGLDRRDEARAEQFLSTLEYLPASPTAARQAGKWRYAYRRHGTTLTLTGCLIAAVADEHHATVVTGNVRHFPQVTTLAIPRRGREGG